MPDQKIIFVYMRKGKLPWENVGPLSQDQLLIPYWFLFQHNWTLPTFPYLIVGVNVRVFSNCLNLLAPPPRFFEIVQTSTPSQFLLSSPQRQKNTKNSSKENSILLGGIQALNGNFFPLFLLHFRTLLVNPFP